MLCSLQGDFSCLFHAQFHCLYILAVGSYHNLEVAWFYHVLQICVVELEHIWGDIKAYLLAFTYCQMDALETFQFLYRAGDAGYHVTDVELHNLVASREPLFLMVTLAVIFLPSCHSVASSLLMPASWLLRRKLLYEKLV